jgi:hypothetical protein
LSRPDVVIEQFDGGAFSTVDNLLDAYALRGKMIDRLSRKNAALASDNAALRKEVAVLLGIRPRYTAQLENSHVAGAPYEEDRNGR